MYRSLISLTILLAPLATGCSTASDAAPTGPLAKRQSADTSTDQQTCVEVFTRNRACTDDFLPALVDARAKLDKPAGIAAAVAKDRDAVVAEARQEWLEDSKDEVIARTCQQMTANMSDAERERAGTAKGCLAQQNCKAYVACVSPVFEKHLGK